MLRVFLLVFAVSGLLSVARAHEPDAKSAVEGLQLQLRELDIARSKQEEGEADLEIQKLELELQFAREDGDERRQKMLTLDIKRLHLHREMRGLATQMKRLELEIARHEMRGKGKDSEADPKKPSKKRPTPVRFEYSDELDMIIIRGPKEPSDRLRLILQEATKKP